MHKTGKNTVVLMVMISVCLVCAGIFIVGSRFGILQFVSNNPESGRKIANSIVEYTLPGGYLEQGGLNLGVFKMVFITPGGEDPQFHARNVILLASFPSAIDVSDDDIRRELLAAMLRSSSEVTTMGSVGEEITTIRGEEAALQVFESFGAYDPPVRMVFTPVFSGKSGDVMMVFAGPIATWDPEFVDHFIQSIK